MHLPSKAYPFLQNSHGTTLFRAAVRPSEATLLPRHGSRAVSTSSMAGAGLFAATRMSRCSFQRHRRYGGAVFSLAEGRIAITESGRTGLDGRQTAARREEFCFPTDPSFPCAQSIVGRSAAAPPSAQQWPCPLSRQRMTPKRLPHPQRPRRCAVAVMENDETLPEEAPLHILPSDAHDNDRTASTDMTVLQDDDIVLETPVSLLPCMAVRVAAVQELREAHRKYPQQNDAAAVGGDAVPEKNPHSHPAARGVGQDVIDLVTDVFTAQREAAIKKRREVLYELTHPNPIDYTYNGKLVPPPPLSFGRVTDEARVLGNTMMLGQTYSLVRRAGTRASADDFDTSHYSSTIVTSGGVVEATAGAPSSCIEVNLASPTSAFSRINARNCAKRSLLGVAPYRSRSRERNMFRDHNYFFEINELYQEIAFVGKACAGKSSLLNALLGQNVAKTSSTPNTTRKISFYQSVTPEELHAFHAKEHHNQLVKLPGGGRQLTFVDLPGYGIEGMSDKWRDAAIELTDAYFGVRRSVNTVLFCLDCEKGLTKTDVKYFEWIENVHGTCFVVLTKCDSVPHSRVCSVMRQVYSLITKHRRKYRKVFPYIIPVSAQDGTNVELLRGLITETSGMIPGGKLRDLLQQKKEAFTHAALLQESGRIEAARLLERAQAKKHFQLTRGDTCSAPAAAPATVLRCEPPREKISGHGAGLREVPGTEVVRNCRSCEDDNPDTAPVPGDVRPYRCRLPLGKGEGTEGAAPSLTGRGPVSSAAVQETGVSPLHYFSTAESSAAAVAEERRKRRHRFLAWRRAHPLATASCSYDTHQGDDDASRSKVATGSLPERFGHFRLNTGIENPQTTQAILELPTGYEADETSGAADTARWAEGQPQDGDAVLGNDSGEPLPTGQQNAPLLPSMGGSPAALIGRRTCMIGLGDSDASGAVSTIPHSASASSLSLPSTGSVSRFVDVMTQYSSQPNMFSSSKQRRKEQRRVRNRRFAGSFFAEDAAGRLSAYEAGRPKGPSLMSPTSTIDTRQAEWRAAQLKALLAKENPEAPWAAVHQLRRKVQQREEAAVLAGMRKKEVAAYARNAGQVIASFDKFEGEVTAAKYVNEIRQAPTLRSQKQMHFNATAKINYRSMPPGLWKRYGEKDSYWPTPRVLGRQEDESHKQ